jgi:hypothetical protein
MYMRTNEHFSLCLFQVSQLQQKHPSKKERPSKKAGLAMRCWNEYSICNLLSHALLASVCVSQEAAVQRLFGPNPPVGIHLRRSRWWSRPWIDTHDWISCAHWTLFDTKHAYTHRHVTKHPCYQDLNVLTNRSSEATLSCSHGPTCGMCGTHTLHVGHNRQSASNSCAWNRRALRVHYAKAT